METSNYLSKFKDLDKKEDFKKWVAHYDNILRDSYLMLIEQLPKDFTRNISYDVFCIIAFESTYEEYDPYTQRIIHPLISLYD